MKNENTLSKLIKRYEQLDSKDEKGIITEEEEIVKMKIYYMIKAVMFA